MADVDGDDARLAELKQGFWQEHRRLELSAQLRATPAQRLAWLEAAIEFARRAGALPEGRRRSGDGSGR
jgi:hypothetical protein